MGQRMAGSNPIQPSSFGPVGADPLGRGRAPRGEDPLMEDPLMEEQQDKRSVTQQMVRQIRAEDEGREIAAPERKRRSEYAGQRNMRGMIRQIREQEKARKRAN